MIRIPDDSIAIVVADHDDSVYRWHFLFAEDVFVIVGG